MKRFLIVLLGSFCSLFCRMFPANAVNPSDCQTQVQTCTSQNKAPTPGPTGASGGVACSGIQCVATGSSAVGTGYTVDGSNCTVCATNICNTGSGYKCQLKAGLDNSWDKYLCSSWECIKSGSGSSGGGSTICPKGQYLSGTTCVKCPNGATTTGSGATMVGQCVCDLGYYSSGPSVSGTGAVPTGGVSCTPCAIGFYKSGTGNGECTRCPNDGFLTGTSPTGATSETLCFVPGNAITGTDTNGQYTYEDSQCFYKS